jgi:hypothetical protein
MIVHGADKILTFDAQDFVRYKSITVVHPETVLALPAMGAEELLMFQKKREAERRAALNELAGRNFDEGMSKE